MSSVAEIREALAKLSTPELREIEEAVRSQYRSRKDALLYDDIYGIWTEDDQTSAAAEAFALMDREEAAHARSKTR